MTDITITAMNTALDTIRAVLKDLAQKEQERKKKLKPSVDEFDALFTDAAPMDVAPEGWQQ